MSARSRLTVTLSSVTWETEAMAEGTLGTVTVDNKTFTVRDWKITGAEPLVAAVKPPRRGHGFFTQLNGEFVNWPTPQTVTPLTEQKWLAARKPEVMLDSIQLARLARGGDALFASDRKLRLWCLLMGRHISRDQFNLFLSPYYAGRLGYEHAEGRLTDTQVARLLNRLNGVSGTHPARLVSIRDALSSAKVLCAMLPRTESTTICALLRCVMGNPFQGVTLWPPVPSWPETLGQRETVRIAQKMYDQHDFSPDIFRVLADALSDAGCPDERVLAHCLDRCALCAGAGMVYDSTGDVQSQTECPCCSGSGKRGLTGRGDWVIDAILGKE